jgi:O-antigen ligase
VLALLTLANFASPEAIAEGQIRFAASGQDPNDVARFLVLGFPFAALLYDGEPRWWGKAMAAGYLPVGLVAVLLTASRGGALAAAVALIGCGILLARGHVGRVVAAIFALPALAAVLWFTVPAETFLRLATIPEQLRSGDLNQRWNIWAAGWNAFVRAPIFGHGAGTYIVAAGTAPMDTAHNSALAILVEGGLFSFAVALAIVLVAAFAVARTRGALRLALATALVAWLVTSMASTVQESRTTWLLLALIALAGRLAQECPELLAAQFPDAPPHSEPATLAEPAI